MTQRGELNPIQPREVERIPLDRFLLDEKNPRFGFQNEEQGQGQILDYIVEKFGVDDVLNSLAVNGYFEAEPLMCRKYPNTNKLVVVEGNRRLAACLIITGDQRAARQKRRTDKFRKIWEEHDRPSIDPIPAIVFDANEQERAIQSYLGVRHIASALPWDSYAKAAWVAQVVENNDLSIGDVSQMIGDQHRTVNRLLQGYYLVHQLAKSRNFNPQDSIKRGRGSVTDYPFSWIYTVLDYSVVREYLGIEGMDAQEDMIPKDKLERGGGLLHLMFGNRALGQNAAISDSRQIGELASALASPEKVQLLEEGRPLSEVVLLTKPIDKRLSDGLGMIRGTLRDLIARLSEQEVERSVAVDLSPVAQGNRRMANDLARRIQEAAEGEEEE